MEDNKKLDSIAEDVLQAFDMIIACSDPSNFDGDENRMLDTLITCIADAGIGLIDMANVGLGDAPFNRYRFPYNDTGRTLLGDLLDELQKRIDERRNNPESVYIDDVDLNIEEE